MTGTSSLLDRPLAPEPIAIGPHPLGGPRSLICVPLTAQSERELFAQAAQVSAAQPDVVEWRTDYFSLLAPAHVADLLPRLRETLGCPILATCRAAAEGGQNQQLSGRDRLAVLHAALEVGADAVDVELATPGAADLAGAARARGRLAIISAHYFDHTPEKGLMLDILLREQAMGATVAKLAVMPQQASDVTRLLDVCVTARRQASLRIPLIAMSMGALGQYSRVVGPLYGVDLVFAVAAASSAPGQPDIGALRAMRGALAIP